MSQVTAYAVDSPDGAFHKTTIERREPGPTEIVIAIAYAGICHSDIHTARGEWGRVPYPLVPWHEIAGVVSAVGSGVTKHAVGDHVGVGCFVDSCGACEFCLQGQEQFCTGEGGTVWTYNGTGRDGRPTEGGYSAAITVEQDYALKIPRAIDLRDAAPLLCAGITTYSPLRRWGAGPGKSVGVIGMGGLGHVGVQIAAALGAEVSVLSRTMAKEADGLRFGATHCYATQDTEAMRSLRNTFDLLLCTVSGTDEVDPYLRLLKPGGVMVDVGLPEHPVQLRMGSLAGANRVLAGSNIGGIPETQEMLDFCAAHGVRPQHAWPRGIPGATFITVRIAGTRPESRRRPRRSRRCRTSSVRREAGGRPHPSPAGASGSRPARRSAGPCRSGRRS
uniref:NAD(P)-dependent alcohol dehydrogenase n=1 Tax=Nigerium massiliense TaxID=1522317 RepID=UPI000694254E|nr:NAD(P)-dependent alcohol dehydrogenase [Nigerium massiliense]